MSSFINPRTAAALNAIGQVIYDAGNHGMSRAAIADELKRSRPNVSNLITQYTGDDKCFKVNAYGQPVVNVQQWDETTKRFKVKALRNGALAKQVAKANAENSIEVEPSTKRVMVYLSKLMAALSAYDEANLGTAYAKLTRIKSLEATNEQLLVRSTLSLLGAMRDTMDKDPAEILAKVMAELK